LRISLLPRRLSSSTASRASFLYAVSTSGEARLDVDVTPTWGDSYAADGGDASAGVAVTVVEDAADERVSISAASAPTAAAPAPGAGATPSTPPALRLRLPQQADLELSARAPGNVAVRGKLEGNCAVEATDGAVELLATVRGLRVALSAHGARGDVRVRRVAEAGTLRISADRAVDALRLMADDAAVTAGGCGGRVRIGALYAREASLIAAGAGAGIAVDVLHGRAAAETEDGPVALLGVAGSVRVRQRWRGRLSVNGSAAVEGAGEGCRVQFEAARGASTVEADGDVLVELAVPCAPLQLRLRGTSLSMPPAPRADMRVSVEGRHSGGSGSEWVGAVSAAFDDAAAPARGGSGKVRTLASGDAAVRGAGFYAVASDGTGATLEVVARGAIRVRFALFEELAARSARERARAQSDLLLK